mgnify:CR=1 FL=1
MQYVAKDRNHNYGLPSGEILVRPLLCLQGRRKRPTFAISQRSGAGVSAGLEVHTRAPPRNGPDTSKAWGWYCHQSWRQYAWRGKPAPGARGAVKLCIGTPRGHLPPGTAEIMAAAQAALGFSLHLQALVFGGEASGPYVCRGPCSSGLSLYPRAGLGHGCTCNSPSVVSSSGSRITKGAGKDPLGGKCGGGILPQASGNGAGLRGKRQASKTGRSHSSNWGTPPRNLGHGGPAGEDRTRWLEAALAAPRQALRCILLTTSRKPVGGSTSGPWRGPGSGSGSDAWWCRRGDALLTEVRRPQPSGGRWRCILRESQPLIQ